VAFGPPEAVAKNKRSHTGHYLAEVLARRPFAQPVRADAASKPRRRTAKATAAE